MDAINPLGVAIATIVGFVIGGLWYSPFLFGDLWWKLRGIDPAAVPNDGLPVGKMAAEIVRVLVVATTLAWLQHASGTTSFGAALLLGLILWLGFQAITIAGSVIHEDYPPPLYAIHVGDALVKTLAMSLVLAWWR